MSLKLTLATAGVVAAAATVALPIGAAPAAPTGAFTLQSRLDQRSLKYVDVKPRGHTPGDTIVFSAVLRRDGKPSGRAEYVQTLVDGRYRGISMVVHLLLRDGRLDLLGGGIDKGAPGVQREKDAGDLAIVGGTGAYAGATGVVHVIDVGRTGQRLEVTLGA